MKSVKLANDAASIVACTIKDYMDGNLQWEPFIKSLWQNFPKEVACHIERVVSQVIK